MPLGILVNALSVIVGGGIGLVVKDRLDQDFKEKLNMIFGVCAMGMGVSTIVLMKNMPAGDLFSTVFWGKSDLSADHTGDDR